MRIDVKRVYDLEESDQGYRVLVDRLWPRGLAKTSLRLDEWCKEIAPDTELRKWFAHDMGRWDEFRKRYAAELSGKQAVLNRLRGIARRQRLLLLYAARDTEHNHAAVLKEILAVRLPTAGVGARAMAREEYAQLPLVYSCSGCSSAAQLANTLALRLDRERLAEMSCIAGVGGDVRPLVKTAVSARQVVVLDGCPLQCAKQCLDRHGVSPTLHIDLSTAGVRKRFHEDATWEEGERVWSQVVKPAISEVNNKTAPTTAKVRRTRQDD